jgi:hypothetical protein
MSPTTESGRAAMIARVRALLAKAESTDYPAEAEALFAKATELMDKYRIEDAAVRDHRESFVRATYPLATHRFLRPSLRLLGAVAKHYGVVVMIGATGNSKAPTLIGEPSDIEATVMMFRSLVVQRDRACLAERVPPGVNTNSFRSSFALGYAHRIAQRLYEMRKAAEAVASSDGNTTALEVYGREQKVLDHLGNPGAANQNKPSVDRHGATSGIAAADTADLGQDRIEATGPRAIGA